MGRSNAVELGAAGTAAVPRAAAGNGSSSIRGGNNDRAVGRWRILHKDQQTLAGVSSNEPGHRFGRHTRKMLKRMVHLQLFAVLLTSCVSGKYNLAVQTRSNVSRCIPCPDASSPVRVSRPRGNASRPRNTSRPSNISNDRRGQPSSSAMSTVRGSPIRRQCSCCTAATEWNENRQITATSGANKKKSQKKMKEMIHTSAVTIARTTINISSL